MSRRLFEQTENTNPNTDQRLAFGRAGNPTENISLSNLRVWLNNTLVFLSKLQNLNDLPNKATARTNLGVYSTSEVDTALSGKSDKYPTAGGALATNNVNTFTPTAPYHPATKYYVDQNANDLLYKGSYTVGDVTSGVDRRTITFPTVGTSSYIIVGELYDLAGTTRVQDVIWGTAAKTSISFQLCMKETASNVQNLIFYFRLYPL